MISSLRQVQFLAKSRTSRAIGREQASRRGQRRRCRGWQIRIFDSAPIVNLTVSQAGEWGEHGIRVNCIAPGPIDTEGAAPRVWPNPTVKKAVQDSRALRRFGRVEEIAYPCLFLASEASSYVTGALLIVDGGVGPRAIG